MDTHGTLCIGFGGGEPTLHPQLFDLCAYATNNTRLAVSFTTHGHHLTEELLSSLKNKVQFVRVSMGGVGSTYERTCNRSFDALLRRLDAVRNVLPFGINYLVNEETLPELDAVVGVATRAGASELLLLPEQAANGRHGLTGAAAKALQAWVIGYTGSLRLAVSEAGAEGMPTCNPLPRETGLRAYAHIDAHGLLKRTSFETRGIAIKEDGILPALRRLHQDTHFTV